MPQQNFFFLFIREEFKGCKCNQITHNETLETRTLWAGSSKAVQKEIAININKTITSFENSKAFVKGFKSVRIIVGTLTLHHSIYIRTVSSQPLLSALLNLYLQAVWAEQNDFCPNQPSRNQMQYKSSLLYTFSYILCLALLVSQQLQISKATRLKGRLAAQQSFQVLMWCHNGVKTIVIWHLNTN